MLIAQGIALPFCRVTAEGWDLIVALHVSLIKIPVNYGLNFS